MPFLTSFVFLATQSTPDPYKLPIGSPGTVQAAPGDLVSTKTGKKATVADVVEAAKGKTFVYLGENHATSAHQNLQASVITALAKSGRKVAVGLEMITRPKQDALDQWISGELDEEKFKETVDWKTQWGFDYTYYKPIFDTAKENKLPMIALNVPRDWVRKAGRGGLSSLPLSAKMQLPASMFLGNKQHKDVFLALIGGHPGADASMVDRMYQGQVLWDEGMADTALKFLALQPKDPANAFVVVAGVGHVMYGQGINYRVERRKGGKGITVSMLQSDEPVTVSKGIGDFVFVSRPEPKKPAAQ